MWNNSLFLLQAGYYSMSLTYIKSVELHNHPIVVSTVIIMSSSSPMRSHGFMSAALVFGHRVCAGPRWLSQEQGPRSAESLARHPSKRQSWASNLHLPDSTDWALGKKSEQCIQIGSQGSWHIVDPHNMVTTFPVSSLLVFTFLLE